MIMRAIKNNPSQRGRQAARAARTHRSRIGPSCIFSGGMTVQTLRDIRDGYEILESRAASPKAKKPMLDLLSMQNRLG